DSFREFLSTRLAQGSLSGQLFPDWLRAFARERLQLNDLPYCPPESAWEGVLTRCALRLVEAHPQQPKVVRELLQEALERRVELVEAVNAIRDRNPVYSRSIPETAWEKIRRRYLAERTSIAPLFGRN